MRTSLVLATALLLGACTNEIDTSIKLDSAEPAVGSLLGGTRILIHGQGFRAAPNRVLIGNREAPLAAAVNDSLIEVVTPPGDASGDAPITVFNPNGQGTSAGLFRYSAEPTISSVTPTDVPFNATNTTVTVVGSGFQDEDAGFVKVFVNGVSVVDVNVTSDTQLTFTAPAGIVFDRPTVRVVNDRGHGEKDRAYRVVPSVNPTLMMFSTQSTNTYVTFFDPMTGVSADVPNKDAPNATIGYRATVRDANDVVWAIDRNFRLGKVDIEKQQLVDPITISTANRINALRRVGNTIYALSGTGGYGTFDLATGTYTQITTAAYFNRVSSMATDGTTLYLIQPSTGISTLTPATGARGAVSPVTSSGGRIGQATVMGGTLYSTYPRVGNDSQVISIDPANGAVTILKTLPNIRFGGVEVFNPGSASTLD